MAKCLQAQEMAYCPYSGFAVGAAILTTGGAIITGKQMHLFVFALKQHDSTTFYLAYIQLFIISILTSIICF